jgi:ribosomal protein L9
LKTGANHKVYWWIWEKDIIAEIKKKYKIELSKKHIEMPDGHIKKLWENQIFIKFGKDAMAKVFIVIKEA